MENEKKQRNEPEKIFIENIKKNMKPLLPNYDIKIGENLVYRVITVDNINYIPNNIVNPKKVYYSFETDILVKKNNIPLVIIEVKISINPHNVILYSAKARKHKFVYPFLRYGLLIGKRNAISNFFYNHNEDFDFAFALYDSENIDGVKEFVDLIKDQIKSAELLLEIFKPNKNKTYSFNSVVNIK